MSSSTEVLRHARLFAAGLLLVVHAPFSPFRGTVTLQANGAPLKDGEGVGKPGAARGLIGLDIMKTVSGICQRAGPSARCSTDQIELRAPKHAGESLESPQA